MSATAHLSASQLAERYGFTARHWTRQAAAGNIPGAYQPSGNHGHWLFDLAVFQRWASANGIPTLQQPFVRAEPLPSGPKKPKRAERPNDQVYFAFCAGKVKIGVSNNVTRRLHGFRTASAQPVELLAVLPGSTELETRLHSQFSAAHSHGEWFSLNDDLRAYLHALPLDFKCGTVDLWERVG